MNKEKNKVMVVSPNIKWIKERFLHSKSDVLYGNKILSEKKKNQLEKELDHEILFSKNYSVAKEIILQHYYLKNEVGGYEKSDEKIQKNPVVAVVEETGLENENEYFERILESYGFAPDNRQFHRDMFKKHFSQNLFNDFQGRMYLFDWLKIFGEMDLYYITPYTTHTTKTFKNHEIICTSETFETQANSPMNNLYKTLFDKYFKK